MKFPSIQTAFLLIFLQAAVSTNALPFPSTISVREVKGQIKKVKLGPTQYNLQPLSAADQGHFSDTYSIVGGFKDAAAILKVVTAPRGSEVFAKTKQEIRFLEKVGLLLHSEVSGARYFVVLRNVRKDFPTKGSPGYKPIYEWYIENEDLRGEEILGMLREILYQRLSKFATEVGLMYSDFHLGNLFTDERIENVMPIDWGPRTDDFLGVVEVADDAAGKAQLTRYLDRLEIKISEIVDIWALQRRLEKRGKALRDNDVPKNIKLRFKDKFYDVRPIAKATYAIVGGFKGVPAEMKVLRNYEGPDAPTIRAEINRLIQGKRYLDAQASSKREFYYIVYKAQ